VIRVRENMAEELSSAVATLSLSADANGDGNYNGNGNVHGPDANQGEHLY
jgi:hypothetical protein